MNAADTYERFVRPALFSLNPEMAHHLAVGSLRVASRLPFALRALHAFRAPPKPKTVFGLNFPNPIGLAAGFDKNGVALPALAALGFGFVEIGTVTAKAQPGNPRPRIFRYPEQGALINRLGFNNDGADVVAARLRRLRGRGRWPGIPVGINLGKSKVTPIEDAADDYLYSFRLLREFADYVVLNVSSPNTPGLRMLQEHDALQELLRVICKENQIARKRILLKVAPDLSIPDLEQVIATCEENEIAGIIATNTTLDHSGHSGGARSSRRAERPTPARKIDRACPGDRHADEITDHRFRWNFRRGERQGKTGGGRAAAPGLYRLRLPRPRVAARDRRQSITHQGAAASRPPDFFRPGTGLCLVVGTYPSAKALGYCHKLAANADGRRRRTPAGWASEVRRLPHHCLCPLTIAQRFNAGSRGQERYQVPPGTKESRSSRGCESRA